MVIVIALIDQLPYNPEGRNTLVLLLSLPSPMAKCNDDDEDDDDNDVAGEGR